MTRYFVGPLQQQIENFQDVVWALWTPRGAERPPCLRCSRPAVCLHEIVPRSLDRLWYNHPENSVPLCDPCHQWAGGAGKAGRAELCKLRDNLPRPDKSTAV